jgi:hypothetical protein
MGEHLRRVAHSTNIKERLDYSCALFDAHGRPRRERAAHPRAPRRHGRDGGRAARRAARCARATCG